MQIATKDISIGYHRQAIIQNFCVSICQGEFWGIVGPNGSGKTTLIKTLTGVIPPLGGEIAHAPGLTFGYVPQESQLDNIFPLTVLEVVLMGRVPRAGFGHRLKKADRDLALHYMQLAGVGKHANHQYRLLSGGQKQRVLIARALTFEPDVLILDEPASGMDISGEAEMMQLILDLRREFKRTILMITHDLNVIANYVEKLIILHGGADGHYETGTVDELMTEEKIKQIYRQDIRLYSAGNRICVFVDKQE